MHIGTVELKICGIYIGKILASILVKEEDFAVSVAVAVKAGIPRWHNRPELCINNAIAKQPKSQKLEQAHLEVHTHTRGPWLL